MTTRTAATFPPPVPEARRWLDGVEFPADRPLINVSQAAPVAPPPVPMLEAMAETVRTDPEAHLYGPVLGLPALREEVAAQWSIGYGGTIPPGVGGWGPALFFSALAGFLALRLYNRRL